MQLQVLQVCVCLCVRPGVCVQCLYSCVLWPYTSYSSGSGEYYMYSSRFVIENCERYCMLDVLLYEFNPILKRKFPVLGASMNIRNGKQALRCDIIKEP